MTKRKSVSRKGGKKKWIQKASQSFKRKGTEGSFRRWCQRHGFDGVTAECIAMGKRSNSAAIRKKANFAANVRKKSR